MRNRVIVITGASSGIGAALAQIVGQRGWSAGAGRPPHT
jgi:NAD(P)-dependent dehydrogenase (short-subunit alcohol dehydrogenase family)